MPEKAIDAASLVSGIQGWWQTIYTELDGIAVPEATFTSTIIEYSGNTFKVEKAGVVAYEGTFLINASSHPCTLVYIYSKSLFPLYLGGPRPGIMQLEGDTLKTCMGTLGSPPPTEFNTFFDSNSVLSIYRKSHGKPKLASPVTVSSGAISQVLAGPLAKSGAAVVW